MMPLLVNTMNSLSKERVSELCEECDAWCCKWVLDKIEKQEEGTPRYYEILKYQKTRAHRWFEDGKWIRFVHYCPCKELDLETNKCKIYKDRPDTCRKFPAPVHYNSAWRLTCKVVQEINKLNNLRLNTFIRKDTDYEKRNI